MANEFVARKGIISLGSLTLPYTAVTDNYTASTDDFLIDVISVGLTTVTLPSTIGIQGKTYVVRNSTTTTITVNTSLSQTIDGNTSRIVGINDSLQVISTGTSWKIYQTSGPISAATNNALITSDGSVSGMVARTGATFDGKTLSLKGQDSGTTFLESYTYELSNVLTTSADNNNQLFSISKADIISLDIDYRLVQTAGNERIGTFKRFATHTLNSRAAEATTVSGTCNCFLYPTANTTNIILYSKMNSNLAPVTFSKVYINVRATKII